MRQPRKHAATASLLKSAGRKGGADSVISFAYHRPIAMWTCLFVPYHKSAARRQRKEVFLPLSHRFIVTATRLPSLVHFTWTAVVVLQPRTRRQLHSAAYPPLHVVGRSIFFSPPHSSSYPLQNNGCFVDRRANHPLHSVTNSASLGFLYQLGYCHRRLSALVKKQGHVLSNKSSQYSGEEKCHHLREIPSLSICLVALIWFFFSPPMRKSTHDLACVLRVVDGLQRNFAEADQGENSTVWGWRTLVLHGLFVFSIIYLYVFQEKKR